MLEKFELGNFKAFGDTQTIDLKSLTLLFGANSAGKSTILQSLIYLSEAFKKKDWDIYSTRQGGEFIDFGGLQNIVHQKDVNKVIHFGLTVSGFIIVTPSTIFSNDEEDLSDIIESLLRESQRKEQLNKSDLEKHQIPYYECTFTLRFGIHPGANKIEHFSITEEHADLITYSDEKAELVNVEADGEVLLINRNSDDDKYDVKTIKPFSRFFLKSYLFDQRSKEKIQSSFERVLDKEAIEKELIREIKQAGVEYDDDQLIAFWIDDDDENEFQLSPFLKIINKELNDLNAFFGFDANVDGSLYPIDSPVSVHKFVSEITHMGYFRPVPDRFIYKSGNYQTEENINKDIWEALLENSILRNSVNKYMSDPDKLDMGYQLEVHTWESRPDASRDSRRFDRLEIRDLKNDTVVNLRELGQGVIQIIPIIAALLDSNYNLVSIEQPELHLHPGLQSRVGKLFAEFAMVKTHLDDFYYLTAPPKKQLLIETHSEHIVKAIQLEVAKHEGLDPSEVNILYVQKDHENPQSIIRKLSLDEGGSFTEPCPDDFFESSSDLTYERLKLSNKN